MYCFPLVTRLTFEGRRAWQQDKASQGGGGRVQKILDRSGMVWNYWTGALSRPGVAGADANLARTRALAAYKDFLALWKDADAGIPIYQQAKTEYGMIQ